MTSSELNQVASLFVLPAAIDSITPYGNGLINHTYLLTCTDKSRFVLQKINTSIFKNPDALMKNFVGVCSFLEQKIRSDGGNPARETLRLIPTRDEKSYLASDTLGHWRLTYFIDNASAYDAADREGLLFEAAYAFGKFQRRLGDYPADTLHETIPNFHNTAARYEAFERALAKDAVGRAAEVTKEIAVLREFKPYASVITNGLADGSLPTRVTHNDTKLNNVLIDDETGKGICVLDLDTVMPGSLLYDFGDSIRFAANNGAEDDRDLSNVWLNLDLYREYVSGFLKGVGDAITEEEKKLLPLSSLILTYELALRFMTDYLDGDVYFKTKAPDHNLVRTRAQICLMQDIREKLDDMASITK